MFHVTNTISKIFSTLANPRHLAILSVLAAAGVQAQPAAPPTTPDNLCYQGLAPQTTDGVETPVGEGYSQIFDGTSWKGWWHHCRSGHTGDKINGAVWRLAPDLKAIYSTQRGTNGGLLVTKKKYGNYEIVFDIWPAYGNDGGWFNRVDTTGKCYQTVMDYLQASSFGGTWGEGGYQGRDHRPFTFNGNDSTIAIPSSESAPNWTKFTRESNPTSFGCPSSGCTQTEWRKLWNRKGWNTVRIKFYGGLPTSGANRPITMESFFRNDAMAAGVWVPLWKDVLTNKVDIANYVGFQVHGGGRFGGAGGNWYRNVKIRELDDEGKPVGVGNILKAREGFRFDLQVNARTLLGSMDADHVITLSDLSGRRVKTFVGGAGPVSYDLGAHTTRALFLDIRTDRGASRMRVNPIR